MSLRVYIIYNVVTGLLKTAAFLAIVFWLLPEWGVELPVWGLILFVVVVGTYEFITFRLGMRALVNRAATPPPAMVGCYGRTVTPLAPDGYVKVQGELWKARSLHCELQEGDGIVVLEVKRLTLIVTPCPEARAPAEEARNN
jgi:membrane-bound ClpP family serine protease